MKRQGGCQAQNREKDSGNRNPERRLQIEKCKLKIERMGREAFFSRGTGMPFSLPGSNGQKL
jgi:hypothetical protein